MKKIIASVALFASSMAYGQSHKIPVYAEAGLGFGQTLFSSDIRDKLRQSLGGSFEPGIGNNLLVAFYAAPDRWKGLGIGSRVKGTFGTPVKGESGDSYIFNYYHVSASAKYYFRQGFNKGFYGRGSLGFGQLTTKRLNETTKSYVHQYAIGTTLAAGLGYSFPLRNASLGLEAEFETSSRNGTVSGVGDGQVFKSGQLGLNLLYSF